MNCPRCGAENRDNAEICEFCRGPLSQSAGSGTVEVKVSKFAIVSLICGLLTPILIVLAVPLKSTVPIVMGIWIFILALICGLRALDQMAVSGGKIVGKGLAVTGIAITPALSLLILLMIILGTMHSLPPRMICGTNLSRIGKQMLIYANDFDDELPRAGGKDTAWTGRISDWRAATRTEAYGLQPDWSGGQASISSSLYLLVKYAELTPKSFVCKQDVGTTEWRLSGEALPRPDFNFIDAWDFGPEPQRHCSYSYHAPYSQFRLTTNSNPGLAVAADRNPWIDSPFAKAKDFSRFKPDMGRGNGTSREARWGNTRVHQEDGQSVLFLDSHVTFEKRSFCGVEDDNIYTYWNGEDKSRGIPPRLGSKPASKDDSLLVNDPPVEPKEAGRRWWLW